MKLLLFQHSAFPVSLHGAMYINNSPTVTACTMVKLTAHHHLSGFPRGIETLHILMCFWQAEIYLEGEWLLLPAQHVVVWLLGDCKSGH